VLVCGGRDFVASCVLWGELDTILRKVPLDTMLVVQGGARGADQIAREWCKDRGVPCANYPADWERHGKAAGLLRNQRMLDKERPNLVLAFPGGRGTADMIRRAKKARIEVREITHDRG
jgi:hypothetical protein